MRTAIGRPTSTLLLAICAGLVACGDTASEPRDAAGPLDAASDALSGSSSDDPGEGAPELLPWPPQQTTQDFIITSLSFLVPEGIAESRQTVPNPCGVDGNSDNTEYQPLLLEGLAVDGFDLDGVDSQGEGPCAHSDYPSPAGAPGVDFGFLHVMDMVRPARPGQTVNTVLASAPSQGLVRIGIRVVGVDDLENDDQVRLIVTTLAETPLLGADGKILAGGSVPADNTPEFQSVMRGEIVDGELRAGPADFVIGRINLLVVENRVVTLRDARLRATISELPTGGIAVDAIVAGWWERDSMVEAISKALLTIGANAGELECVLDQHLDHAMDGETCDAMSTIFRVEAVSGFITGLVEPEEATR